MAKPNYKFDKRQRDIAKKKQQDEKMLKKRAKNEARTAADAGPDASPGNSPDPAANGDGAQS